ncbi:hypothetical protein BK128_09280 [Viridibacillus sp. FSL H7-0596]|uniref:hypothetical protein n=1 Tax=Viridibacillus sp. FSL H7-0596 TaxID=1928923 RepID=UPI00096DA060|nr:hypothetical protein [Viridibacillus sp. FSL H7-0596]OMC86852.1 hypothetical protein BK128_09280 [Viridibacillus sp. FSL H7-0596]
MKVYLSGKVMENNWRDEIYEGLILLNNQNKLEKDGYIYNGPFIGTDEFSIDKQGSEENENIKKRIYNLCDRRIQQSEIVFVWINHTDIYRVLYEIIFAYSQKKYVFVGIEESLKEFTIKISSFLEHTDQLVYANTAFEAWKQFVEYGPLIEKMRATEEQIKYIRDLAYNNNLKPVKFETNFTKGEAGKLIGYLTNERYKELYAEDVKQYFINEPYTVEDIRDMYVLEESEVKKRIINEYRWPPTTYIEKIEQLKRILGIQKYCENSEYFKTFNQKVLYNGLWLLKVDEYYGKEKPVYSQDEFKEIIEKEKGGVYSNGEFEDLLKRTKVAREGKYSRDIKGKGRLFSGLALERVLDIILKDGEFYEYAKTGLDEEKLVAFMYTPTDVERIIMEECYVTKDEFINIHGKLVEKYRTYKTGTSEYHEMNEVWDKDERYMSYEVNYNERWLNKIRKFISNTKMIYTFEMLIEEVNKQKNRVFGKLEFEQIVRKSKVRKDIECYKEKQKLFSPKALQTILNYLSNREG